MKTVINAFIGIQLSKTGQRDAIMRGKNPKQKQTFVVEIPEECIDLFEISSNGVLVAATHSGINYLKPYAVGNNIHAAGDVTLRVDDLADLPRFKQLSKDIELDAYPDHWADIYRAVLEEK
jgi:hypothetical protein